MFSTWKAVASRAGDAMTMSRSSLRTRWTKSMAALASLAGSTVKSCPYLFLKYRASFARNPASASTTGDDSNPTVETVLKSTVYPMGPEATPLRQGGTVCPCLSHEGRELQVSFDLAAA